MKRRHLFWGILFLSLGILFLLDNLNTLGFNWFQIWRIWPVLLILWGVLFALKENTAKTFLTGVIALLLAVVIFASFKSVSEIFTNHILFNSNHEFGISLKDNHDTTNYYLANSGNLNKVDFNFKAGMGNFEIKDSTSQLFHAISQGVKNNYDLSYSNDDSIGNIKMELGKRKWFFFDGMNKNNVLLAFNSRPYWDMNFDIGAASTDFDLSNFKVENLKIDMGAASLRIKLGDNVNSCKVDIDGGVSSIHISVPEKAGCEIKTDVGLSSKNFHGFNKINSGFYRTENFDSSMKKIFIKFKTGVSALNVDRY
jgi:LiaF transmembrane domain